MVFFVSFNMKLLQQERQKKCQYWERTFCMLWSCATSFPLASFTLICTVWFLSLKGIFSWCLCLFRERDLTGKDFRVFYWYKHENEFICSSELITPLSLVLASFIMSPAHYHSKAHCTFLCTKTNFSSCLFFLNPQQFALMFRVQWYTRDVTVHESPRRGELLLWVCSVVLTPLTFGALWW